MRRLPTSLLPGLLTLLFACTSPTTSAVRTATRQTATRPPYSFLYLDNLLPQVVTQRPPVTDPHYLLSVAAAYTDLPTDQPLDLLVCQGQPRQAAAKVGFLDGVLTLVGKRLTITRVPKGQSPPTAELARVRQQHGTILLQELLVYQGQNQRGPGGSLFQRRALVELADHRFAVVESATDALTMQQFAADLVALGARNALYLDMGDWDEGWYRAGGEVVSLGHRRTETSRQSNWLVFTQPATTPK